MRGGQFAAGSVGVITGDGVNVMPTKGKSALSIIEDSLFTVLDANKIDHLEMCGHGTELSPRTRNV